MEQIGQHSFIPHRWGQNPYRYVFYQQSCEPLTPPLLFFLLSTGPLGPRISAALLSISFQRFLPSCPSKHASSSFLSVFHPPLLLIPGPGLALVEQLNPLECSCYNAELSRQWIHAGSPQGLQVPSFSPFAEIYWSNKSSAMMEKN